MSTTTAPISQQLVDLMGRLASAGVRLSPNGEKLRFSSSAPLTPELRELIVTHKAAILSALSVWCSTRAAALQHETDTLVAQHAVGSDPEIAAAAARCVEAHSREDMAGVRAACHAIADLVRKMFANQESQA